MKVHCELKGTETTLDKTRIVTRINGVINLKLFIDPRINFEEKLIYSATKPPIKFFSKLYIPTDLKPILGDLFATVTDEDELEQSTHILSDEGFRYLMGNQFLKLASYLDTYEMISFPDTMLFVTVDEISAFKTKIITCDNWGIEYHSIGKKYFIKRILETKKDTMKYGFIGLGHGVLLPGFDVGVSDVSEKNPNGTGYQFKTEKNYTPINLCSNESAVDYCVKNNCLAYFTDLLNGGKMRVLTKNTESINKNLQNVYRFRSINL